MDQAVLQDQLNKIWLALVLLAFFDCLLILVVGLAAAWSVALVSRFQDERQKEIDDRYKSDRGEFVLMAQTMRKIREYIEGDSNTK